MPDLNSVPPSPRNPVPSTVRQPVSRQQMPPPPLPSSSSVNTLPLVQRVQAANRPPSQMQPSDENRHVEPSSPRGFHSIAQASPSNDLSLPPNHHGAGYFLTRETIPGSRPNPIFSRESAPGNGPGPTRLPRPITAADLHLQLEKEQEAMINFLSRELHALREAHNSSVASNTSSASASASGTESGTGTNRRALGHYRTSSNTSSVSFPARPGSVSVNSMGGISSPAPVRPQPGGVSLSRQNSTSSQVGNPSPPLFPDDPQTARPPHMQGRYTGPSLVTHVGGAPPPLNSPIGPYSLSRSSSRQSDVNSRPPISGPSGHPAALVSASIVPSVNTVSASEPSPAMLPATSRYEETAFYRRELDTVKRENEALKRQIRELERMVSDRRASDAIRAGSVAVGVPEDEVRVGVPEDEVRVGESAASAGVQQGGSS